MVRLAPAKEEDWARLFAWRNEAAVQEWARSTDPVPLKDHFAWMKRVLHDSSEQVYLATDHEEAGGYIGVARLKLVKRDKAPWAEVSIAVDPRYRGRGYGTKLVERLVDVALADESISALGRWKVAGLVANVKPTNYVSLRAFADCKFSVAKFDDGNVEMVRPRDEA